jgi:hypothetical protein
MGENIMRPIGLGLLTIGFIGTAYAHHSNDYHFDQNVAVTVTGVVNQFRFINPHSRLIIDALGDNGEVITWDCEMGAANGLQRRGWSDEVFKPGEKITIQGFAARHNETECYFDYADMGDGRRITMTDEFEAGIHQTGAVAAAVVTPAGVSGLNGIWSRVTGGGGGGPQLGGANRQAWVLSEAGQRALAAYDPVLDDPALRCNPVSIVRLWGNGDLTQITEESDRVTIHHEWMDAERIVHLGAREHPSETPENVLGHSIGWYEGDTLVIDTIGYPAGMLHQHPGLPHSDKLHTVERLTLNGAGDGFELAYTAEDSDYFIDKLTGTRTFEFTISAMREYNCTH